MKSATSIPVQDAGTWGQLLEFERELSPTAARALLQIRLSPREQTRVRGLVEKSKTGRLTPTEEAAIDTFERLACLLDVLHSKARVALKKHAADA